MRRGDGARCWPSWLALAGVAAASTLGALLATLLTAQRAGATERPPHGVAAGPVELTFQSVRCDDWSLVPGNVHVSPLLDDTGGRYLAWGPAQDGLVVAYGAADLPAGCVFIDGVGMRATSVEHGNAFVPIAANHQPAGAEDGSTTSRLGETGNSGSGQLVLDSTGLTGPQQAALAGGGPGDGGLWVAADLSGHPDWDFANLRCHRDTYNADNREVVRPSPAEHQAACVLFVVGAAEPGSDSWTGPSPTPSPLVTPAPPPTPTPVPTAPAPAPNPAREPGAGPGPQVGTEVGTEAPPTSPAPLDPSVPVPPGADPSPPPDDATGAPAPAPVPPGPGRGEPTTGALTPAPAGPASPPAAPTPAPPAGDPSSTVLPDGSGTLDPLRPPSPVPTPPLPLPGTSPLPGLPTIPRPHAGPPPPTTMALLVEVGGVTRGTPTDRPGGARSPWVRPVVVDLSCGAALQRRVEVQVGQVPGFQVESEALLLPTEDHRCEVRPIDDGVDPAPGPAGAAEAAGSTPTAAEPSGVAPAAVVRIDGQEWHRGDSFTVRAGEPGERLVRVNVTFAALPLPEPTALGPRVPAPSGDQPISPVLTAGLVGVFALGLAGAVARARRPS